MSETACGFALRYTALRSQRVASGLARCGSEAVWTTRYPDSKKGEGAGTPTSNWSRVIFSSLFPPTTHDSARLCHERKPTHSHSASEREIPFFAFSLHHRKMAIERWAHARLGTTFVQFHPQFSGLSPRQIPLFSRFPDERRVVFVSFPTEKSPLRDR